MSPRDGMRNSRRTRPVPWFTILVIAPAARAELLGDDADVLLGHVDDEVLHRLVVCAVLGLRDDPRACETCELEALAPHRLDQDRELELAAPETLKRVGRVGLLDPDADVACGAPRRGARGAGAR